MAKSTYWIILNVVLTVCCTISALWPPLGWLSLINAAMAGAGLMMVFVLFADRMRDRAFSAMREAFLAISAMNDDLIARLHRRELGLEHDRSPSPNQSKSLH